MNPRITAFKLVVLTCFGTATSNGATIYLAPPEPIVIANPVFEIFTPLDLNNDGVVDFQFQGESSAEIFPMATNRVVVTPEDIDNPQRLQAGQLIGADVSPDLWQGVITFPPPLDEFVFGLGFLGCGVPDPCRGSFANTAAYMGLEFDIGGETHYGWALVEGEEFFKVAYLHGWAYETEPGVAIAAGAIPEPGTVALLALGVISVFLCRSR